MIFEGTADGAYKPVIAAKENWGLCFDGMLFHPVRKRLEYWCGSGGGAISWDGKTFKATAMKGD